MINLNAFYIINPQGESELFYEPTEKQLEFHSRQEPNVLLYGGRGSGKSIAMRMDAHMRALSSANLQYCILRTSYPELEKTHILHIRREITKLGGHYNASARKAFYPNGSIGFFSYCGGEEDVLNLLSAEFAAMYFDELSTFEWDHFTRLAASVRVTHDSGLTGVVRASTNPLGPSAEEILHYFVDKDVAPEEDPYYIAADWYALKANLEDNPHVDQEQYMKRMSGFSSHVRKAWVEGDFALENALFDVKPTIKLVDDEGNLFTQTYHYIKSIPTFDGEPIFSIG